MGNAAGDASAGREAAGHLNFISDAPDGLGVAHDEQGADLRALLLDKIQRDLDAAAGGSDKLALRKRTPALESIEYHGSERGIDGEYVLHRSTQQRSPRPAEEALDGSADQDNAGVPGEQH